MRTPVKCKNCFRTGTVERCPQYDEARVICFKCKNCGRLTWRTLTEANKAVKQIEEE